MDITPWENLSPVAQRVFVVIEQILDRYLVDEMTLAKWDLEWECIMSRTNVKNGLRELKKTGWIESKNENSSIIRVGEPYRVGGLYRASQSSCNG
jgi:hypothetical protein